VGKKIYCRGGQGTDDNMAVSALHAGYLATDTQSEYVLLFYYNNG